MQMQQLRLKLAVKEARIINGFSYPFLRLLVDKLKELEQKGEIFNNSITEGEWREVNGDVEAMLGYVKEQLKQEGGVRQGTCGIHVTTPQTLIADAEKFLGIFEMTREEFIESQRTPER